MILSPTNLNKAYKHVKSNKGSGGIDGMGEEELQLSSQTECVRCVKQCQDYITMSYKYTVDMNLE